MGFQIYIASSWKNAELVNKLAELLRDNGNGFQVYSFAEMFKGQHHFNWPDVLDINEHDGITALECEDSKRFCLHLVEVSLRPMYPLLERLVGGAKWLKLMRYWPKSLAGFYKDSPLSLMISVKQGGLLW